MNRHSVFKLLPLPGRPKRPSCRLSGRRFSPGVFPSLCGSLILALPIGNLTALPTQEKLSEKVASAVASVSKEKLRSVVRIRCMDSHGEINGTGFYLDPTGTVCTLSEIVRDGRDITVLQEGSSLTATVLVLDPRSGVALLRTEEPPGKSTFVCPRPLTNAADMTPVIGIGFPRNAKATPSLGMITGTLNHEGDHFFCVPHFIAGIPLSEGEGGSPVFDLSGGLLGMVVNGNTQSGSCTILPAAAIDKLYREFIRFGCLNPGWVGAIVEEAAIPVGNSSARVASVMPGSPAEAAGIRQGDMILSLGGHAIHAPEDVLNASFYLTAGETVRISLMRGGDQKLLSLQSTPPPGSREATRATGLPLPSTDQVRR